MRAQSRAPSSISPHSVKGVLVAEARQSSMVNVNRVDQSGIDIASCKDTMSYFEIGKRLSSLALGILKYTKAIKVSVGDYRWQTHLHQCMEKQQDSSK